MKPMLIKVYKNREVAPSSNINETIIGKIYERLKNKTKILNKLIMDFRFIDLF